MGLMLNIGKFCKTYLDYNYTPSSPICQYKTQKRKETTTMSKIGYIRVSTEHQETASQQEIMDSYQVDRIFSEKISGANKDRPQLKAMLDYLRDGDTLYIESISRLGRSTKDLLNIIDTLTDKGVTLVSNTNSNTTQSNIFIVE